MSRAAGTEDGLADLVGHLYDAAIDQRLWTGIASRIAAVFDSSSTVVKTHGGGSHVLLLETTDNLIVAKADRAWADNWHRNDLWVDRSVAFGLSRIVTSQDLVSAEEEKRSPFYQEWLRRLDIHHMVGVAFPAGEDRIGVLGIHRPREAGRYTEADRQKVKLLLPHLQRALHLGRRLAATSLAQAAALDALDHLDVGVVIVDCLHRLVYANALAEDILRHNPEIGVLNGRLIVQHTALNAAFAALVRDNLKAGCPHPTPAASALAIPRDDRLPLTLAITPLRPIWSRRDGQQPLALVFMRDAERPAAFLDQLCDLFDLTRTEAAVAADLATGRSLLQIALARGVGLSTVRSHLKKILAKTGTNRQAELVALVAHSVVAIPGPR